MKHKKHTHTHTQEPNTLNPSFFEIDLNELDRECSLHPKMYHEYALQLPEARQRLEEVEAELKVVKAEIDKDIRSNPAQYELKSSPTEASIATAIPIQPSYQSVQKRLIRAQYQVNMIEAMLKSIDRKGNMIDNAVKLHGQDYFSPIKMDSHSAEQINNQRSDRVAKLCAKKSMKDRR